MKVPAVKDIGRYAGNYSPFAFHKKLVAVAQKVGQKLVYCVLLLYYLLLEGNISTKDKTLIIGTLGYFIFPFDLMPDALVGMGHADDLGAILILLNSMRGAITPDISEKAQKKTEDLLGFFDETMLKTPIRFKHGFLLASQ